MGNDDKLPRGHAFIHMRNRGYKIDVDYPETDSAEAESVIKAIIAIVSASSDKRENDDRATDAR